MNAQPPIGVLIIGDEILSGRRCDTHLAAVIERLAPRGLLPAWVQILGDDAALIERALRQSQADRAIVFSFGGIGATPDDLTRAAAAAAFDQPLVRHAEAERRIIAQFGEAAFPHRVFMADLPASADLIPNPVNQVAGFSLANHYFMPGFPNMAHPMLDWVLANPLAHIGSEHYCEQAVWTLDATESDLMPIMNHLSAAFGDLKLFSLPTLQAGRRLIELGFKGEQARVIDAMAELRNHLQAQNVAFYAARPSELLHT